MISMVSSPNGRNSTCPLSCTAMLGYTKIRVWSSSRARTSPTQRSGGGRQRPVDSQAPLDVIGQLHGSEGVHPRRHRQPLSKGELSRGRLGWVGDRWPRPTNRQKARKKETAARVRAAVSGRTVNELRLPPVPAMRQQQLRRRAVRCRGADRDASHGVSHERASTEATRD